MLRERIYYARSALMVGLPFALTEAVLTISEVRRFFANGSKKDKAKAAGEPEAGMNIAKADGSPVAMAGKGKRAKRRDALADIIPDATK
jgi:hypothetical protein